MMSNLQWQNVPAEACRLAKVAAGTYQVIQDLIPSLPDIKLKVWYNPDRETAFISYPLEVDTDKVASWHIALKQVPGVDSIQHSYFSYPLTDIPYIQIKSALDNKDLFKPVAQLAQFASNPVNNLFGGPNPLAATIGGGLLGAGLGYGGGWLAEKLLPEEMFEPGVLRKNTALAGGLIGTMPGLWSGLDKQFRGPTPGWQAWIKPYPWNKESRYTQIKESIDKALPSALDELWIKGASEAGGDYIPNIPVDQFGQVIWNDLRTQGGYTSAPVAAATTGLVQAASLSQNGAAFVSPMDIARIGIGMGSGYVSGAFVGKTLGALAGLRPEAQQSLQQAGVWAGILNNVVPMLFR